MLVACGKKEEHQYHLEAERQYLGDESEVLVESFSVYSYGKAEYIATLSDGSQDEKDFELSTAKINKFNDLCEKILSDDTSENTTYDSDYAKWSFEIFDGDEPIYAVEDLYVYIDKEAWDMIDFLRNLDHEDIGAHEGDVV